MANLHIAGSTEIDDSGVTLGNIKDSKVINSSGSGYIKFQDGTLICYGVYEKPSFGANGTDTTVNLPQKYKDTGYMVLQSLYGSSSYWTWLTVTHDGMTVNNFNSKVWNNQSAATGWMAIEWMTIGRWK